MRLFSITEENLYINNLIHVMKNSLPGPKHLQVNGRHSDAFVYILTGSCTYCFDDGIEFTANAGDVLYLAHHAVYTMDVHSDSYDHIFCDFEFCQSKSHHSALLSLHNTFSSGQKASFSQHNSHHMEQLFEKLVFHFTTASPISHTECISVLYKIYGSFRSQSLASSPVGSNQDKLEQALSYMESNFKDPTFSISALAEEIKISEVYFRKLFKAKYHMTPSEYITSLRLQNAKKLMRYPFLALEECAQQSGFSSLQYFCRVFKKEHGISPGKYRR